LIEWRLDTRRRPFSAFNPHSQIVFCETKPFTPLARRCSRRYAEAHGVAQREVGAEAENDARQHGRRRRPCSWPRPVSQRCARCPVRLPPERSSRRATEPQPRHGLAQSLMDSRLFIRLISDLPTDKVLELAQAWFQQMDTAAGRCQCPAGGVENKRFPCLRASLATRAYKSSGTPSGKLPLATTYVAPGNAAANRLRQCSWILSTDLGPRQQETVLIAGLALLDGKALAREPVISMTWCRTPSFCGRATGALTSVNGSGLARDAVSVNQQNRKGQPRRRGSGVSRPIWLNPPLHRLQHRRGARAS
jgi:hypothetical protein